MDIKRRPGESTAELNRRKADFKRQQEREAREAKERARKERLARLHAERRGTGGRGSRRGRFEDRVGGRGVGVFQRQQSSTQIDGPALLEDLRKWVREKKKTKKVKPKPPKRPKGFHMGGEKERERIAQSMARTFESRRVTQRANRMRDLRAGAERGDMLTARDEAEQKALDSGGVAGLAVHRGRKKKRFQQAIINVRNRPNKYGRKNSKKMSKPTQQALPFAQNASTEIFGRTIREAVGVLIESKAFKRMHRATAAQANADLINAFSKDARQKKKFKKKADRKLRQAGIEAAKEIHRDAAKLQGIKK